MLDRDWTVERVAGALIDATKKGVVTKAVVGESTWVWNLTGKSDATPLIVDGSDPKGTAEADAKMARHVQVEYLRRDLANLFPNETTRLYATSDEDLEDWARRAVAK